jgi:hypothetical protein
LCKNKVAEFVPEVAKFIKKFEQNVVATKKRAYIGIISLSYMGTCLYRKFLKATEMLSILPILRIRDTAWMPDPGSRIRFFPSQIPG